MVSQSSGTAELSAASQSGAHTHGLREALRSTAWDAAVAGEQWGVQGELMPGAPTTVELFDDVKKIGVLLASGFTLDQIRADMKLTRRQLFTRLALMRRRSKDASDVWPKFLAKMEVRYRQFEGIRQRAIQAKRLDTALRAIENMVRLDQQIIQVGQELGMYEQVAKETKITVENPTLGMFHSGASYEIEAENVTPIKEEHKLLPQ